MGGRPGLAFWLACARLLRGGGWRALWMSALRPRMTLWFPAMSSARRTSFGGRGERRRALAGFFISPQGVAQRRYEALRAYFLEGATAAQAAKRFGYAPATMVALG